MAFVSAVSSTVSVTADTTPSTVSVTPVSVFVTSVVTPSVRSVVVSDTEREEAGSSSALAAVEPSAHAPVTPAAMTMERRMFLFMGTSGPWELCASEAHGGRNECRSWSSDGCGR
ncbi:hypothetical protein B1R27_37855 [Streptomyces sp. GKU 895]|nr:hypothetical protein B1R27_37855 [Streptomyces sp. GKU 895]